MLYTIYYCAYIYIYTYYCHILFLHYFVITTVGIQKIDDGMELKTAFITMSCDPSLFPGFVISGEY